jgi:cell division protein FtsB
MLKGRNNSRDKIYHRLLFLGGVIVFCILFFGLIKEIINRRQIDRQIADYESRIAELKVENSTLNDKIINWNTSGELESSARAKLGLEKPGERTIIIVRPTSTANNQVAIKSNQQEIKLNAEESASARQTNPIKWWQYFFEE